MYIWSGAALLGLAGSGTAGVVVAIAGAAAVARLDRLDDRAVASARRRFAADRHDSKAGCATSPWRSSAWRATRPRRPSRRPERRRSVAVADGRAPRTLGAGHRRHGTDVGRAKCGCGCSSRAGANGGEPCRGALTSRAAAGGLSGWRRRSTGWRVGPQDGSAAVQRALVLLARVRRARGPRRPRRADASARATSAGSLPPLKLGVLLRHLGADHARRSLNARSSRSARTGLPARRRAAALGHTTVRARCCARWPRRAGVSYLASFDVARVEQRAGVACRRTRCARSAWCRSS